ncbi:MAG: metal-sensing transcriptional repressor [Bacillota bacterium]|jgi:DNA-binding FrmR family transcriptional regulator
MENKTKSSCDCCRYKNTPRSEQTLKQLKNRINRIVGQLNGIQKMLEDNRYCGDILTQIAAAESALQGVGYIVLQDHMETCVVEQVKNGNTDIIAEAIELIKKLK